MECFVRDAGRQATELCPEGEADYIFIIKVKWGRGKRPPSSSFFESPIINSSYMLGRGVFDLHGPTRTVTALWK